MELLQPTGVHRFVRLEEHVADAARTPVSAVTNKRGGPQGRLLRRALVTLEGYVLLFPLFAPPS